MSEFDLILHAADKKTWLRERLTPGGIQRWLGEKFISDYKTKMDTLRSVDDQIASWAVELKDLSKKMRGALKSSRLVDLALLLNLVNKKLISIESEGQKIQRLKDEAVREFELQHEMELPESSFLPQKKSAGWLEDKKREWVRKKFDDEKRKKRFLALQEIVSLAEQTVEKVESAVKLLHVLRAKGEIGKYLEGLKTISLLQKAFQTKFFAVYSEYLEEFVNQALVKAQKKQEERENNEPELEYKPDDKIEPTKPGRPILPLEGPKDYVAPTLDDPTLNPKSVKPLSVDFGPDTIADPDFMPDEDVISIPPSELASTMSPSELDRETLPSPKPKQKVVDPKVDLSVSAALLNIENEKFWKKYSSVSEKNTLERFALLLQHSENIENYSPKLSIQLLNYAEEMMKS